MGRGRELPDAGAGARARSRSTPATSTRRPSTRSTRTARRSAARTTASAPSSGKSGTRPTKRCVWVAKGCEDILDEDEPHLELQDFFPCPKPAYGTLQRGSLVPVPDVLQYKDQLDESQHADRAHPRAVATRWRSKGFYPAGGAEIADAVQTAVKIKTPGRLLVPISNWAAFGGSKEVIIWMPIDMIATDDHGVGGAAQADDRGHLPDQGLADIMRGATDPSETLGAQQLKTPVRLTRIRDKQQEMVRMARDLVEITAEIITEEFDPVTIIEMSQTQLPTRG